MGLRIYLRFLALVLLVSPFLSDGLYTIFLPERYNSKIVYALRECGVPFEYIEPSLRGTDLFLLLCSIFVVLNVNRRLSCCFIALAYALLTVLPLMDWSEVYYVWRSERRDLMSRAAIIGGLMYVATGRYRH